MRAVEYSPVTKEAHTNPRSFSFTNFRAKGFEQILYVDPSDIGVGRALKNLLERLLVLGCHDRIISKSDVKSRPDSHRKLLGEEDNEEGGGKTIFSLNIGQSAK